MFDSPQELGAQLRRLVSEIFGAYAGVPPEWEQLLISLDQALNDANGKRALSDLQSIIDALPDLLLFVAEDGTILEYKMGSSSVVNLPAEIPFVKRVQELPKVGALFGNALREAGASNELRSIEYSLPYRGEEFHFEARFHPAAKGQALVLIRDVTKRKLAENSLRDRIVQFELLKALQLSMVDARRTEEVAVRTQTLLPQFLGVDDAALFRLEEETGTLLAIPPEREAMLGGTLLPLMNAGPDSVSQAAFQLRHPVAIHDYRTTEFAADPLFTQRGVRSTLAIPIVIQHQAKGVLRIDCKESFHTFTQGEIDFCQMLGEQVGLMMENVRLFAERNSTREVLRQSAESYQRLFEEMPLALYHLDQGGRIVESNRRFMETLGFSGSLQMKNLRMADLYLREEDRKRWQELLRTQDRGGEFEAAMVRFDGREIWVRNRATPSFGISQELIGYEGFLEDITQRRDAEIRLNEAVREKELLLKEIHHRVKNNLQIISSLLSLQAARVSDPDDIAMFRESQNRVKAMSLLHERLYQSADFARVDFTEYLHSLTANLFHSYKTGAGKIDLQFDVQDLQFDMDTAIPCGLIVGELLSNCLKHAFPDGRDGTITVRLHKTADGVVALSVEDDGVGLQGAAGRAPSLGMELVETLAAQLQASVRVQSEKTMRVIVSFRERQKESNPS